MPLLKYKCSVCGRVFEDFIRLSELDSVSCRVCGARAYRAYEGKCNSLKPNLEDTSCLNADRCYESGCRCHSESCCLNK